MIKGYLSYLLNCSSITFPAGGPTSITSKLVGYIIIFNFYAHYKSNGSQCWYDDYFISVTCRL